MGRTASLTFEVDEGLLTVGIVERTKRTTAFLERVALRSGASLRLHGTGDFAREEMVVSSTDDGLKVEGDVLQRLVGRGDRIVIRSDLRRGRHTFEIQDGSYVFVQHVLKRASPSLVERLMAAVPTEDPRPRGTTRRDEWVSARNEVLEAITEDYLRGPAAAIPLKRWLERRGLDLVVLDVEGATPAQLLDAFQPWKLRVLKQEVLDILEHARVVFQDPVIDQIRAQFERAALRLESEGGGEHR